jgi:hypothetical protein
MKKTKYLTDKEPGEFSHLMQPLAEERIKAMEILKRKLVYQARAQEYDSKEYKETYKRYKAVVDAIKFWNKLLEEE